MSAILPAFGKSTESPIYEQVREHLRAQFSAQAPSTPVAPLRELSEALGVNPATVTRALRDLETDGLLRIIPRKGTFVAHSAETRIELLTITYNADGIGPTSHRMLTGMQEAHRADETVMGTTIVAPPFPDSDKVTQSLQSRNVAGLAVSGFGYFSYPHSLEEASFLHAIGQKLPLVLAGKPHDLLELDTVYCDPRPQLRAWLEECYRSGARNFAYLASMSQTTHYGERLEAFRQFLLEHSLLWKPDHVPPSNLSAVDKVEMLLNSKPLPEVVIANATDFAYAFVLAAHRRGIEPGRDVQVLCFTGAEEDVEVIAPYVTALVMEEEEVGRCALRRIEERLKDMGEPAPYTWRVPARVLSANRNNL